MPLVLFRCLALLFTLTLATPLCAQDAADTAPPETPPPAEATPAAAPSGLDGPRSTIRTFVDAIVDDRIDDAVRCLDVSGVDPALTGYLPGYLFDTMTRIEEVDPKDYPAEVEPGASRWVFFPHEFDPWHQEILDTYRPAGRIELVRGSDGGWRFSAETVEGISELRDSLLALQTVSDAPEVDAPLPVRIEKRLLDAAPALVRGKFLNVKYWQWLGIFALIVAGTVLDLLLRLLLMQIARRWIRRRGGEVRPLTIRRAVRPFGLALGALFWILTIAMLGPSVEVMGVLLLAVRTFWVFAAVWAAWRVTDLIGEVVLARAARSDNKFDDLLVPLVRKAVKIFIFAFGIIYIAGSLNVDIKPLLTGLGIGGVGFAFAAKDTLENFFGSITVVVDRPFQVGDWVTIGDTEGTVEELGLRSVRIRTFYNSLVTIPTANLVRASVDNYGRRKYRRWTTHLNLTYDTPPEKIEAYCEGLRELIRVHPYTRKDYYQVWLHKFGAHSLDVLVYLFFEAPDWQTELRERHRFIIDAIRLAAQVGVEFAFPTQTLHVVQDGEPEGAPPIGDRHRDAESRRAGRHAVGAITSDEAWRRHKPPPHRFHHPADADEDDETQIESKVGGDA